MWTIMLMTFLVGIGFLISVFILVALYEKYVRGDEEIDPYTESLPFDEALDEAGLATHEVDDYARKVLEEKTMTYDLEVTDKLGWTFKFNTSECETLRWEKDHYLLVLKGGTRYEIDSDVAQFIADHL